MRFEIGDWVQAKTRNGEFVHGFIDSLDPSRGFAKVYIVKSDNEESVGKTADVLDAWLRALPTASAGEHPEALRSLIDLALATKDEVWFRELSGQLLSAEKSEENVKSVSRVRAWQKNRLGYPA